MELAPPHLPRLHAIRVDVGMLVFGSVLTFVTSLLCGVLPAWYGARTNLEEALREGGRTGAPGARSLGWHRTLVVAQVALCFVLLVCAGLLARTFYSVQRNPVGFRTQGVLTMTYDLPGGATRYGRDAAERAAFHERLLTTLRAEPGVLSAGIANRLPFAARLDSTDSQTLVRFTLVNRPVPADERPFARLEMISSGYLEALSIPLLEGRMFDARDTLDSARVVLVNQELVRRYFSGDTVVGKTLGNVGRTPPTIVGVVGDVKATPVAAAAEPAIYIALSQSPAFRMRLAVRTEGNPQAMLPMIRRVVTSIDPELPVFDVKPLDEIAADAVATRALCAVVVRPVRRARAGAERGRDLRRPGLHRGATAPGVRRPRRARRSPRATARDGPAARRPHGGDRDRARRRRLNPGGRWIRGLLFGVQPFDPATLGAVAVLFGLVALAACFVPARRAARVDPLTAIRND